MCVFAFAFKVTGNNNTKGGKRTREAKNKQKLKN